MTNAIAVESPRPWIRFGRMFLIALVALTIAVGSIAFSADRAGAYRNEQIHQSQCDALEAEVWYWFEEGQDALNRGDRFGYVVANTFAEWYLDAWVANGCAG